MWHNGHGSRSSITGAFGLFSSRSLFPLPTLLFLVWSRPLPTMSRTPKQVFPTFFRLYWHCACWQAVGKVKAEETPPLSFRVGDLTHSISILQTKCQTPQFTSPLLAMGDTTVLGPPGGTLAQQGPFQNAPRGAERANEHVLLHLPMQQQQELIRPQIYSTGQQSVWDEIRPNVLAGRGREDEWWGHKVLTVAPEPCQPPLTSGFPLARITEPLAPSTPCRRTRVRKDVSALVISQGGREGHLSQLLRLKSSLSVIKRDLEPPALEAAAPFVWLGLSHPSPQP